jgi:hypothetical protein
VVVQIDACRFTLAAIPLKDEPPLLVDADRMEPFQIREHTQVFLLASIVGTPAPLQQFPVRNGLVRMCRKIKEQVELFVVSRSCLSFATILRASKSISERCPFGFTSHRSSPFLDPVDGPLGGTWHKEL